MEEIKDLKEFYNIICEVINKKVDKRYVHDWHPLKMVSFGKNAWSIFDKNREIARNSQEDLKKMLAESPIFAEAAYIAKDVYAATEGNLIGGWHRCNDFSDLDFHSSDGLVSGLYARDKSGSVEYVYATAGTNPKCIEDWKANVGQLYGYSSQYESSLRIAKEIVSRLNPSAKLTFVGHSLGGGLATNNAIHTGLEAIVFNPAALSSETIGQANVDANKISVFLSFNDILNWFQDTSACAPGMKKVIPIAIGNRYYLYNRMVFPMKSHTMEQMIVNLNNIANK